MTFVDESGTPLAGTLTISCTTCSASVCGPVNEPLTLPNIHAPECIERIYP